MQIKIEQILEYGKLLPIGYLMLVLLGVFHYYFYYYGMFGIDVFVYLELSEYLVPSIIVTGNVLLSIVLIMPLYLILIFMGDKNYSFPKVFKEEGFLSKVGNACIEAIRILVIIALYFGYLYLLVRMVPVVSEFYPGLIIVSNLVFFVIVGWLVKVKEYILEKHELALIVLSYVYILVFIASVSDAINMANKIKEGSSAQTIIKLNNEEYTNGQVIGQTKSYIFVSSDSSMVEIISKNNIESIHLQIQKMDAVK